MKKICPGCGAIIQTKYPDQAGYIAPKVLSERKDSFYCQRCYKLKHYNKETLYNTEYFAFDESMHEIELAEGLIVLVLDLFDLNASLIPKLNNYIENKNLIVFINKYDLLDKHVYKDRLLLRIDDFLKEHNINAKRVILGSSFISSSVDSLIVNINKYRDGKNVYFIGVTNVGKSTLINRIIEKFTGNKDFITTSNTINTTLGSIYIPLDKDSFLVDTPGYRNEKSVIFHLNREHLNEISAKSYIRPKIFQLAPEQSLFIQGILRLDFLEGIKSSFVCYFANSILIHRTKLKNAQEFYNLHKDDILKIPNSDERKRLGKLKEEIFYFNEKEKIDISIYGLGFISLNGQGTIKVHYFDKIGITFRKTLI